MTLFPLRTYIQNLIDYIDVFTSDKTSVAQKLAAAKVSQAENARNILLGLMDLSDVTAPDLQKVTDIGNTTTNPIIGKEYITVRDSLFLQPKASLVVDLNEGLLRIGNSPGFVVDVSPSNLTGDRTVKLPNFSGTLVTSVNNTLPDDAGNIVLSIGGGGTVTSVGLSMPAAFSVSGSPVTGSGVLSVTGAGTIAQYVRGDLSLATFPTLVSSFTNDAGYLTSASLSGYVPTSRTLSINGTSYDLSANRSWTIDSLPSQTGNSGKWLTTNGTSASWQVLSGNISLFTNNVGYLTANQSITLSGDVSGIGSTAITTLLATVNSNVGAFGSITQVGTFTVNAKGLITAASNVTINPPGVSIYNFYNLF